MSNEAMLNETKQPFFSVLIPSYNRPEEITRNIDSILADAFKDVEIVISDDNSPRGDEVRRVVEPYLLRDNIRFYAQPENLREPRNKNFLIEQARGRYSIIIGDDDRFFPNALLSLKDHIDKNPDYDLYCFGYNIVDEFDRTIVSRVSPVQFEISNSKPEIMHQMFCADMLPLWLFHPNTFCCKNGVEKEMLYKTDVGIGEDMYFIFDFLLQKKKILVLPEMFFHWRKIQDLESGRQINQSLGVLADFIARKKMYDKLQDDKRCSPSLHRFLQTKEYRIRFLYSSIISDTRIESSRYTTAGLTELGMSDAMAVEFLNYAPITDLARIRRLHYIKRIFNYLNVVGYKGVGSVLKLLYQRNANTKHVNRLKTGKLS